MKDAIKKVLHRRILVPFLLFSSSSGVLAVFIHIWLIGTCTVCEPVIWMRTLETVVCILLIGYSLVCIKKELES